MQKRTRGRPREYDRDAVLDRAIHLFSLKGYTGTSLDELSACMGMNRPSLYHAFGNKESVYRHALARFTEHLRASVGTLVAAEPNLRTALGNFYRAALDVYFASEPALGCFLFCTAPTEAIAHPEVQADMQDVLQHLDGMLEDKFRQAQCDGQFPPDADCAAAAKVAQGVLHSLAIRARAGEPRASLEQMSHFAVDALCVHGVSETGKMAELVEAGGKMAHWYEKSVVGGLPERAARRFADLPGLIFKDRSYTFAEVSREVDIAARALMELGVKRGDNVSLWLNNCDDWVFIMYALAKIGAVLVPVNTRFRTNDLEYVLRQSDSTMLITHDVSGPIDYLAIVREVVSFSEGSGRVSDDQCPKLQHIVVLSDLEHDSVVPWSKAKADAGQVSEAALRERAAEVDPDDPFLIMYTSGTTGFPKGAMHTHKLIRNVEERGFRMAITTADTMLNYLPLFHAFGFSEGVLMSPLTGMKQILTEVFDPSACLDLIESERVTIIHGFEAHMKELSEHQEARPRDLSSLRTGIFAAGTYSATPVARKGARALAPLKAISGFGMTEIWLGACLCSLDDDEQHRCETSGYPGLGFEVRIVDHETGEPLGPGIEGELQVRGYSVMLGYYKKPDETAAAYTADGWFKTGDMAIWLDDGYLRFLGRYKDMLKVGGENVDPMEVEGFLLEHPSVYQIAVVGCPDKRLTEVAVAYVQKAEGANIDGAQIVEYCRGKVASFKIPRHVVFVDEFPMTASGKIRKVELRADAAARFAAQD